MSDIHSILLATQGWLELGNYVEAYNEIEKLPHDQRTSPDVLKLRCRIYRQAKKWEYLSVLARSCYNRCSEESQFLIDWGWADYKRGRKERAAVILLNESDRFPGSAELAFDLAIVLASLNRTKARDWLVRAFRRSPDRDKIRLKALNQPELEKFWTEEQGQ